MLKTVLLLISFLPLLLHSPYLLQAWQNSRLDHWDWIFYLAAVPAAVWALYKEKLGKYDFCALLLMVPALLLTAPVLNNINALLIASAAGVIFSTVWLVGAWSSAYKVLPATIILLLGTPSSSYQLSILLMCPVYLVWGVKFLLAILCFLWIWYNRRSGRLIKCGTLFFTSAVLASSFLLLHSRELYFEGSSFIPDFTDCSGDFWGRKIQPNENTKRFFATSTVKQYLYTKNNTDISVLAVQCGRDIHEIHPASHCLRTSSWTVHTEKILYLPGNLAVTEIYAEKGNIRILVWVWYSSEKLSTPGFLGFRRHFKPGGKYHTYQISVPIYSNTEASRNILKNFVQSLRKAE